jgi:hypothetical protein
MDQSKKTMRHFYCRDVLWETFEQMANDFDCSIDYLINEAMRYYARSKNYQSASGGAGVSANLGPASSGPGSGGAASASSQRRPAPPTQPPSSANPPSQRRPAPATPGYAGPASASTRAAPPTPAYGGGGGANFATASSGGAGYAGAAAQPYSAPSQASAAPPLPSANAVPSASAAPAGSTLFLVYNGQRYPVNKDQFIIGRGSKTSDLAIKDGNISRKHAAVIRRNGTFYIKDLGSTNGIDYKGMRIDNKRIDEGDVFHLCDYELRFTYRPE